MKEKIKCYAFDFAGEPLGQYDSISEAAAHFGFPISTVREAIRRGSIVSSKYYFSKTQNLIVRTKKTERNPLFRKDRPYGLA